MWCPMLDQQNEIVCKNMISPCSYASILFTENFIKLTWSICQLNDIGALKVSFEYSVLTFDNSLFMYRAAIVKNTFFVCTPSCLVMWCSSLHAPLSDWRHSTSTFSIASVMMKFLWLFDSIFSMAQRLWLLLQALGSISRVPRHVNK